MRLSIALGALAGGLTLGWAVLAEAADQGPPPAAPIFYCPSAPAAHGAAAGAPAAPQSCPAPIEHRHAIEHRRVEPRHERVIVRRERPDGDVSASQAFIYRYEEARRGLNAEAADDAWRREPDHRVHERLYAEEGPPPPCPGQVVDHCPAAPPHDAFRAHVYVEPAPPPPPPVMVRAQPQAPAPVYVQVAPTPPTQVYVHLAPAAPPQVYVEHEHERPAPPVYHYYERPACPDVPRDRCPLADEQGPWNEPAYAEAPPPHRELPPPPAYVEREQYAPRPGYVERERDVTTDHGGYAYERSESEQSSGWRYSDDNGQVRSEHWHDGDRDDGRRDDGRRDDGCPNSCSGSAYQQGEWRDGSYGAVAQYSGRDSYGYLVWPGKSPEQ